MIRSQPKQLWEEGFFIDFIVNSRDLRLIDKIGILEHAADESYVRDNNLRYLELKSALKELKENKNETRPAKVS